MTTSAQHRTTFTPARVVALALLAVVMGGLVYLRLGSASASVSVPAGAKAGDLRLEPCEYAGEGGTNAADCGTLVVSESRGNPRSRLIALPVTRIRAHSERAGAPLFVLGGGPGVTNMEFEAANRYTGDRDVVLVGYRGVDGSSVLDCPEVSSALKHSTDRLAESATGAYGDGFEACAKRLTADGVDVASYSQVQQVDDLEAARVALGYGQIDLLSESAGTRTALIYSWRYPESIQRSVMIGVNPPGHFLWDPKMTDDQLARYSALCSEDQTCRARTDDLAASLKRTAADMPDRWRFLPIKEANVRIVSFLGLFETTSENAPANAPMTLDSWLSAAEGDASGLWFLSFFGDFLFPKLFTWGQAAAVSTQDAPRADAYYSAGGDHGSILGNAATDFIWGSGRLSHVWPVSPEVAEYRQIRTSTVETLLIGGELDLSTPPDAARTELMPYLPNGHQVVLAGFGHSDSFLNDQAEAGNRLVNTFLDSGQVDESLYQPATVDFTPDSTQTSLAKRVNGVMVGFSLLAVVSLLWMARRVHKRGSFGPRAGALLRSLYPIVLGLGGWFLGALLVLATMPGVSLDNQLLAVVFIGGPVGLGIYWAWSHRDWSVRSRRAGLAAAVTGALAGAWLGFHATADLFALATAIVGAVAGANLMLILLDMWRPATTPTIAEPASRRRGSPVLARSM